MKLKNETYDLLKWIVQVFLPAFITFAGVVGQTMSWAYTDTFMTLVGAFTLFLGTLLGISNSKYKKEEE